MEFLTYSFLLFLSLQLEFPANTNILYVDLASAELIGSSENENSLPGLVLNVKKAITYIDQFGMKHWYNSVFQIRSDSILFIFE